MKKRWIALLCMMLALMTMMSCGAGNGNTDTTGGSGATSGSYVNTFGDPKNPYFYVWKKGLTDNGEYYMYSIKANAEPNQTVTVFASDLKLVDANGVEYQPKGFIRGMSSTQGADGTVVTRYDISSSMTYNDSEQSVLHLVFEFSTLPEGAVLYYNGEKVSDNSKANEEEAENNSGLDDEGNFIE